jgi:hypothetical protein
MLPQVSAAKHLADPRHYAAFRHLMDDDVDAMVAFC